MIFFIISLIVSTNVKRISTTYPISMTSLLEVRTYGDYEHTIAVKYGPLHLRTCYEIFCCLTWIYALSSITILQ